MKKNIKVVLIIVCILIAGTFVSRYASSLLTPIVECARPSQMSISHTTLTSANVMGVSELPIYLVDGLLVDKVLVSEGEYVESGTPLVAFNVDSLDRTILAYTMAVEDLKKQRKYYKDKRQIDMDIKLTENALNTLNAYKSNSNRMLCNKNGEIKAVRVLSGTTTGTEAAFLLSEATSEYMLEIPLTSEEKKSAFEGEDVMVQLGEDRQYFPIQSVIQDPYNSELYLAKIAISGDAYRIGVSVDVLFSHNSESYSLCVPVNSLRSNANGGYYVLVTSTRNGILGEEEFAQSVSVTLKEQNSEYAAVESAGLTNDDAVIIESSKWIESGDLIREE